MEMEKQRKCIQNRIQNGRKFDKIDRRGCLGGLWGPSWRQDGPRCELDRIWGSIWRPLGIHLVAKMVQVGAKWRQDGAMLANLDPKMANLAPVWEASWLIFRILSAIFAKIAEVLKRASLWRSGYKLESRAVGLEALGSYVGSCWRYVELCWAIWAPSWSNLATRCGLRAPR